jgi:hypothetical protein
MQIHFVFVAFQRANPAHPAPQNLHTANFVHPIIIFVQAIPTAAFER